MNKDEVLDLAPDWLVCYKDKSMSRNNAEELAEELITAIKQARSAPVQEPAIKQGWDVDTLLDKPAAQRPWVGLETLIPEGWRFYTADFSMQATGKRNCGSVMLIRDEKGVAEWHKLPADLKESDDGPPLYLSGTGKTLQEAIEEASARAIEAKLRSKNEY